MTKKLSMKFKVLFLQSLIGLTGGIVFAEDSLVQMEKNTATAKQCDQFKSQLATNAKVKTGTLQVPLKYNPSSKNQISLFYWVREKLQSETQYPPLLLIHGGVGGNSSGMFTWTAVMNSYPGDIVSLDLRGEGCSNYFGYNEKYSEYRSVTIDATVKDLERLRAHLYGNKRWRIFGQSRGSAIGHRYLESYPGSLESVHVHGLAMMSETDYPKYSVQRSYFNARAGRTFYSLYPQAGQVIDQIRTLLLSEPECFSVNYALLDLPINQQPQVCGADVVDAFSGRLGGFAGWEGFAKSLVALVDESGQLNKVGARQLIQSSLDSSLYIRYLGYIFGTNSQEFHAPDIKTLKQIEQIPEINNAPLSEGRFILNVAFPLYKSVHGDQVIATHRFYDFARVRKSLQKCILKNDQLRVKVYMSEYDPVAGPEAFQYEQQKLQGVADFILIEKSAHDGWKTHPQVSEELLKK